MLSFRHDETTIQLPERPGLALQLTGPSRFEWSHGVELEQAVGDCPERLSMTWRWFRPSVLLWAQQTRCQAELWIREFVGCGPSDRHLVSSMHSETPRRPGCAKGSQLA